MSVCVCVCACVYACVCAYVCVFMCVCVCACVLSLASFCPLAFYNLLSSVSELSFLSYVHISVPWLETFYHGCPRTSFYSLFCPNWEPVQGCALHVVVLFLELKFFPPTPPHTPCLRFPRFEEGPSSLPHPELHRTFCCHLASSSETAPLVS